MFRVVAGASVEFGKDLGPAFAEREEAHPELVQRVGRMVVSVHCIGGSVEAVPGEAVVPGGRAVAGGEGAKEGIDFGLAHLGAVLIRSDLDRHQLGIDLVEFGAQFGVGGTAGGQQEGREEQ